MLSDPDGFDDEFGGLGPLPPRLQSSGPREILSHEFWLPWKESTFAADSL
jgi:hypothetical protein